MTTDDKIRDEKLRYDISRDAAKILALSSGKFDACKKSLPPDESRMIEQAKLIYSPLGKASEKQIKAIEEHEKQLSESNALTKKLIVKKIPQHF